MTHEETLRAMSEVRGGVSIDDQRAACLAGAEALRLLPTLVEQLQELEKSDARSRTLITQTDALLADLRTEIDALARRVTR